MNPVLGSKLSSCPKELKELFNGVEFPELSSYSSPPTLRCNWVRDGYLTCGDYDLPVL